MVAIRIPSAMRALVGGEARVEAPAARPSGRSWRRPRAGTRKFGDRLFAEPGKIRRFVNVFVDDEDIRHRDGLDTPVDDGQVVSILPAWPAEPSSDNDRLARGLHSYVSSCIVMHSDAGSRRYIVGSAVAVLGGLGVLGGRGSAAACGASLVRRVGGCGRCSAGSASRPCIRTWRRPTERPRTRRWPTPGASGRATSPPP